MYPIEDKLENSHREQMEENFILASEISWQTLKTSPQKKYASDISKKKADPCGLV